MGVRSKSMGGTKADVRRQKTIAGRRGTKRSRVASPVFVCGFSTSKLSHVPGTASLNGAEWWAPVIPLPAIYGSIKGVVPRPESGSLLQDWPYSGTTFPELKGTANQPAS